MRGKAIVILSTCVIIGGAVIFYRNRSGDHQITPRPVQKWETRIEEQASVTVVVTPLDLSPKSAEWKFDIGMNTHSVELDQDMMISAVLIDDQGREYKPLSWNGPSGGHHREGILSFNKIDPPPKAVTLTISDIGEVARPFYWQLK